MYRPRKSNILAALCKNSPPLLRLAAIVGCIALFSLPASAQLCNGSLGDPMVNITFGSGAGSGTPLSAATTSYTYHPADCPNDGTYSIVNTTNNCFGTWHTLSRDHTGNPQGYFMLVNASYDPSDFYLETVRGLCSNTTYEFAAWVMNMVRISGQIEPNITFSIEKTDGTVLQSINSGNIMASPTPQWKQYGFFFTTPPGVHEVVLRMTNNAPGGIGNDLALDDITFRPCGPKIEAEVVGGSDTIDICENDIRTFDFSADLASGFINPRYQWQSSTDKGTTWSDVPGATNLTYSWRPTSGGSYQYRLTVAEEENFATTKCRIASSALVINVRPLPIVSAGPDRKLVKGSTTTLAGSVNEGNDFSWSPNSFIDNNKVQAPIVSPESDIRYTLTAISPFGCTSSDEVQVQVADALFIPNAFSPNNDGINDTWGIPFLDPFLNADVRVFNRYGQLVFQTKGAVVSWDGRYKGTPLPPGVYIYTIDLKKDTQPLKGWITLLR